MSRYETMFAVTAKENRAAFIPFTVLGDPHAEASFEICCTLVEAGADALELGIPFSDPIADGPTIQVAAQTALNAGMTPEGAWQLVHRIRQVYPHLPIGMLVYANLAVQGSLNQFYESAAQAGADSVLLADVPTVEARPFVQAALSHGVDPVLIAPPNATQTQLTSISGLSRGYTYVVTRSGVTGATEHLSLSHGQLIQSLKDQHAPPPVFGFGIATPQAVKDAVQQGAAGVISGSAIVAIIKNHSEDMAAMKSALTAFVQGLKAATYRE